jgi:hypothetical protein
MQATDIANSWTALVEAASVLLAELKRLMSGFARAV